MREEVGGVPFLPLPGSVCAIQTVTHKMNTSDAFSPEHVPRACKRRRLVGSIMIPGLSETHQASSRCLAHSRPSRVKAGRDVPYPTSTHSPFPKVEGPCESLGELSRRGPIDAGDVALYHLSYRAELTVLTGFEPATTRLQFEVSHFCASATKFEWCPLFRFQRAWRDPVTSSVTGYEPGAAPCGVGG